MIRVFGDRVLVALPPSEPEKVTESGIVLVRDPDAKKTPSRGIVVQLGEKSGTVELDEVMAIVGEAETNVLLRLRPAIENLGPAPFEVQVGDCVIFPPSSGEEFTEGEIDYVILREAEILGVVEPKEEVAA